MKSTSEPPKLKITNWHNGYQQIEIRDFEEAKDFLNFDPTFLVTVEGQVLSCYDELVRLATQDIYKDKDCLEVVLLPLLGGG